jgi:hypothetical protein
VVNLWAPGDSHKDGAFNLVIGEDQAVIASMIEEKM